MSNEAASSNVQSVAAAAEDVAGEEELLPCPFCGYTLSDHEAVAVDGVHDKCRSCILDGFKVVGMDGASKWNRRVSPGTAANKTEAMFRNLLRRLRDSIDECDSEALLQEIDSALELKAEKPDA